MEMKERVVKTAGRWRPGSSAASLWRRQTPKLNVLSNMLCITVGEPSPRNQRTLSKTTKSPWCDQLGWEAGEDCGVI